jgi:hypothetical protein
MTGPAYRKGILGRQAVDDAGVWKSAGRPVDLL